MPSDNSLRLALWTIALQVSGFADSTYGDWVASELAASQGSAELRPMEPGPADDAPPRFTIVVADTDGDATDFAQTLASVTANGLPGLEIIIATPASNHERVWEFLAVIAAPSNVKVVASGVNSAEAEAAAVGAALGRFVFFLSVGDRLAHEALRHIHLVLDEEPELDVVYSDEDWIDADGRRRLPRFKSEWDEYAQLGFDLLGRLCAIRRERIAAVGGLRAEFYPAHHYDLHLRLTHHVRSSSIRHVPRVLYHRKQPQDRSLATTAVAFSKYCAAAREAARQATSTDVAPSALAPFVNRVIWPLPKQPPRVTVLVPTRDRSELLRNCARGVLHDTDYPEIEFTVLDNDSVEPATFELFSFLRQDARVQIKHVPGPFNYSLMNNVGAAESNGEIIVFMNNDVEVITPGWLRDMVALAVRPDIGCVGAKLLYPDRTIQHVGVVLQEGPLAMHVFRSRGIHELGYDAQLAGVRRYSAVTAACLAIRRELFLEVGGFDSEYLKVAYNDVDLCLKVEERGYLNVCTPFEPLFHMESASRGENLTAEKRALDHDEQSCLYSRWPDRFQLDPSAHPAIRLNWDAPEDLIPFNIP